MQVAIVFNPISGSGRSEAVARGLADGLSRRGVASVRVATQRADPATWLDPVIAESRAVIVAGGDGAMRLVAPSVADAAIPVWHAPCGTENLFARAFGMSRCADRIAGAIAVGRTALLDLGEVNGVPFTIMASVGFDADVVAALSERRTGAISHWSYAAPILRTMMRWRAPELAWTIDGETESLGRGMVVVGNLREYGGRLNPAANAIADDGLLDAVFLPAADAWELCAWVPLLWTRLHQRHPSLRERRGSSIRIVSSEPALVQIDGDPRPPGPVRHLSLGVRPRALRVLLPA